MSVVVVARWRARPGQETALLAGALTLWRDFYDSPEPSVFQSVQDPTVVLYIDEWNRRGEYLLRQSALPARLDALCHAPVERTYYRSRTFFERIKGAAPTVGASLFSAPPSAVSTMHRYLSERLTPLMESVDGCLRRATYENLDDPGRVLVITGWRSDADRRQALGGVLARVDTVLSPLGTRIERFQPCLA
jgi:Antibiotic biosynthesis monooxygenase